MAEGKANVMQGESAEAKANAATGRPSVAMLVKALEVNNHHIGKHLVKVKPDAEEKAKTDHDGDEGPAGGAVHAGDVDAGKANLAGGMATAPNPACEEPEVQELAGSMVPKSAAILPAVKKRGAECAESERAKKDKARALAP